MEWMAKVSFPYERDATKLLTPRSESISARARREWVKSMCAFIQSRKSLAEKYHWKDSSTKFLASSCVSPYSYSIQGDRLMLYREAADTYRRESLDLQAALDIVTMGLDADEYYSRRDY